MLVRLSNLLDSQKKSKIKANLGQKNGKFKFFTCSPNQDKFIDEFIFDQEALIIGTGGIASIHYCNEPFSTSTDCLVLYQKSGSNFNLKYLYYYLKGKKDILQKGFHGSGLQHISKNYVLNITLDLPSLDAQNLLVKYLDLIESIQKKADKCLSNLDSLVKSQFIEMFGNKCNFQSTISINDIAHCISGGTPSSKHPEHFNGDIPFISTPSLGPNYLTKNDAKTFITLEAVQHSATHIIPAYSIMVGIRIGIGKSSINTCEMCTNQDIISLTQIDTNKYDLLFLKKLIDMNEAEYLKEQRGATIKGIQSATIKQTKIPDVSLEAQKSYSYLVTQIDKSKFRLRQLQEKLDTLYKSLLQKYFR